MRYDKLVIGTALFMGLFCFNSCDELDEWWNGKEEEEEKPEEEVPQEDTSIDLQRELKAYYTFNDGTCTDISGNECYGVFNGSPEVIDDTPTGLGCAIFLNGYKEQLINIPQNPLQGLKEATYSFWIKEFGPGNIIGVVENSRMSNPYVSCSQEEFFMLNNNSFARNVQEIKDSWNMVTITQTENEQRFYFNGELYDTQTQSVYYSSSGSKIQIGGNGDGAYNYWQSMKIDNVRIYARALNAYEVAKIYEMESK